MPTHSGDRVRVPPDEGNLEAIMILSRMLVSAACGTAVGLATPAVAAAATTYHDSVYGAEYSATSTQGTFAGTAYGALPGAWAATVNHTVLSPSGVVTGGEMSLNTALNGTRTLVDGDVTGGAVTRTNPGSTGCVNQYYAVNLTLGNVTANGAGSGSGSFAGTLSHYRRSVLGTCVTYSATISGSLTVSF
jgi:hypothetical protein